jgi:hypothetical protein
MMPLVTGPKISAWAASGAGLKIEQVMAVQSEEGVITSVYFIGNPDKLTSVGHGSGARRARGVSPAGQLLRARGGRLGATSPVPSAIIMVHICYASQVASQEFPVRLPGRLPA